jgi:hypothetical protein
VEKNGQLQKCGTFSTRESGMVSSLQSPVVNVLDLDHEYRTYNWVGRFQFLACSPKMTAHVKHRLLSSERNSEVNLRSRLQLSGC